MDQENLEEPRVGEDQLSSKADVEAAGASKADIDQMSDAVDAFSRSIDVNLRAFQGQFSRLSDAILEHTEKVQRGEIEETELGAILKRFDPVLNLSIQQETRLNDKLAERVGKAGKFAISFKDAELEIGRRLARLRASLRAQGLPGGAS